MPDGTPWKNQTYEEFREYLCVLYHQKINERVTVQIGQMTIPEEELEHSLLPQIRSQFFVLTIHDSDTNRWVALRLSTARKIWKFVSKHGWDLSRRLSPVEIKRLNKIEARRKQRASGS